MKIAALLVLALAALPVIAVEDDWILVHDGDGTPEHSDDDPGWVDVEKSAEAPAPKLKLLGSSS